MYSKFMGFSFYRGIKAVGYKEIGVLMKALDSISSFL